MFGNVRSSWTVVVLVSRSFIKDHAASASEKLFKMRQRVRGETPEPKIGARKQCPCARDYPRKSSLGLGLQFRFFTGSQALRFQIYFWFLKYGGTPSIPYFYETVMKDACRKYADCLFLGRWYYSLSLGCFGKAAIPLQPFFANTVLSVWIVSRQEL